MWRKPGENSGGNCAMIPFGEIQGDFLSSKIPSGDGTERFLLLHISGDYLQSRLRLYEIWQTMSLWDNSLTILTCSLFPSWQSQLSQRRHPNWEHGFSFFPISNTCILQQPPWALGWKSPCHGQWRSCRLDNKSVSNWILRMFPLVWLWNTFSFSVWWGVIFRNCI